MLTHSFEDLAQSFRVIAEVHFETARLMEIDKAEAIGNIETALNAQLNSFHNLYDLMSRELPNGINWYETPELLTILAIRNARHHNKANRIRSLYNYHRQTAQPQTTVKKYFYVDFPAPPEEEGGDCFDLPISWFDIDQFLSLPKAESKLQEVASQRIKAYLNAPEIEASATKARVAKEDIFINFIPLALNAGIALQPHAINHVQPDSVEARYFLEHFGSVAPALTTQHECRPIAFGFSK